MIESAKSIMGRSLNAKDERFGCCHDLFFDDSTLGVIYLIADTRKWLPGRKTLLSPQVVRSVGEEEINLKITRELIEKSPPIESDSPVDRQFESSLFSHYRWAPYWDLSGSNEYSPSSGAATPVAADETVDEPVAHGDPNLRSIRDLIGYKVSAVGDRVGRVHDFLIDIKSWNVRYLAVDTHPWIPNTVHLVEARHLQTIDSDASVVSVRCLPKTVKSGPLLNELDLPCDPSLVEFADSSIFV